MAIVFAFFTIGGFGTRYLCEPVSREFKTSANTYELFDFFETVIEKDTGYTMAKSFQETGLHWEDDALTKLSISSVLNKCEKDAPLYQLALLDKVPGIKLIEDELVGELGALIENIYEVISEQLEAVINDTLFDYYVPQSLELVKLYPLFLNETVVDIDFDYYFGFVDSFGSELNDLFETLVFEIENVDVENSNEVAKSLKSDTLSGLNNLVPDLQKIVNLSKQLDSNLAIIQSEMKNYSEEMTKLYIQVDETRDFLISEFAYTITNNFTQELGTYTDETLQFVDWVINDALRTKLGECYNIYAAFYSTFRSFRE